jgi:hypothetical protein
MDRKTLVAILLASFCSAGHAFFSPSLVGKLPLSSHRIMASRGGDRQFSQSLQMLVDVPKQVLVTGAAGRTGFLVFKVASTIHKPQKM